MDNIYRNCHYLHRSFGKEILLNCTFRGRPRQTNDLYHTSCEGCFLYDIHKAKTKTNSKSIVEEMKRRPLRP